ncbi:hypothetical protein EMIT0P176_40307 [Pseudomonas sp. IT-P176]
METEVMAAQTVKNMCSASLRRGQVADYSEDCVWRTPAVWLCGLSCDKGCMPNSFSFGLA